MRKKIMILGASILQLPAIKKAKEMNLQVVAVDMDVNAAGFREDGVIKEVISTIDIPTVVKCAKRHNIDGIITLASDMPIRTVAAVSKELNLVGISDETAIKATNKAEMRKCLFENRIPIPRFYKVSNEDEYLSAVKLFNGAFIAKPADNSGSRGVYLVENIANEKEILMAYKHSVSFSRNGDVLVEEYMRGPEVSVETLTIDGKCHIIQITDKITTGAPHFVEMGHSQPTRLPYETTRMICQVAESANKALGIINGPSHTEIIVTDEGPKIVEIGARLGGDCITTHLVPLSTGVDMVECCIKIALGETPCVNRTRKMGSAIRYFEQTPGVIKSIAGVDAARSIEGVEEVTIVHNVGDMVTNIDSSTARMGFVIAQGENAEKAGDICDAALSKIEVTVEGCVSNE